MAAAGEAPGRREPSRPASSGATPPRTRPRTARRHLVLLAALGVLGIVAVVLAWGMRSPGAPTSTAYDVVAIRPHDPRAFTQGLLLADGELYEGTGRRGASTVRRVHRETGVVLQQHRLEDAFFGEGMALVGDELVQVTWTSGVGFRYDRATLAERERFTYPGEGWGLASRGDTVVLSDGTADLRILDPTTLAEVRRVTVRDAAGPVLRLNELEFVGDELWANVWQTDRIARIDPTTGRVLGYLDLTGLLDQWAGARAWPLHTDVLNGIAWDAERDVVLVTGKLWPVLFELRVS